jgi:RHS repeat-associated protein
MYHLDLKERYEYDAYGNCQIMDASYNPRSSSSYGNPYYFTGRQLDFLDGGNLKIQYNRNRYYDYYTGRWLTPDPEEYADGLNLYEYGGSDPVSRTDPFGDIVSLEECESTVAAISDDPSLKELYDKARTKKNFFGACLKKMKCKKCCRAPLMGIYDPFKRQVTLCAQNNPNADELKRTIRHELIHAISMCGDAMPKSCKACMEEEIRAYYWAGDCDTRERCAKRAWGSCRGGPLSPCGLAKKDGYKKYIPSEDKWPPSKVDGLPGDGPRDKSEVVKWPTCSMD